MNFRKTYILLVILSFFSFCDKEEKTLNTNSTTQQNQYSVSLNDATLIAETLKFQNESEALKGINTFQTKRIKNSLSIPEEENGQNLFHIINYENGGFIILSGDRRTEPVLAYSNNNHFDIDKTILPAGLVDWLQETSLYIKSVRDTSLNNTRQTSTNALWDDCAIAQAVGNRNDCEDGNGCENTYVTKGPLLNTTWGQGVGYNNFSPLDGCSEYSNGKAPSGCVATAMAQIIRYYKYPNNYNWDLMPNHSGSDEISQLFIDIGDAVNMKYTCTSSSANTKNEVASSFINDFNFKTATYSNFKHATVKSQISNNRPVILRGGSKSGWWIFSTYIDGHAWVADGYKSSYFCETGTSYLKLHMNWGWSGAYNGWYSYNNWNPHNYTFNYKKGMIYNIKP